MRQGLTDDLYNAVAEYRTDDRFTAREKLAIEFAEWFAKQLCRWFGKKSIGQLVFSPRSH